MSFQPIQRAGRFACGSHDLPVAPQREKGPQMKIISPSYAILSPLEETPILQRIELAGRTCYKSEHKITADSARDFVRRLIRSGHHSVIEHVGFTIHWVVDRGVAHELVRHRLAAYSQESTRYANYAQEKFGREITVIRPFFWAEDTERYAVWKAAMEAAETSYFRLIELGARPEEARSVLPNSLKTEIVMTCNLREWRHVLDLRCSKGAHPQMREIMLPLLNELYEKAPVLFDDLYEKYEEDIKAFKK